jgi:uncharacterized protein
MMTGEKLRDFLTSCRRVAVVGLSPNPARPSHEIARYLIENGYEVVGVNPGHESILGRPCYRTLAEVPGPLEIVDVFRSSEHVPALVEEMIPLRPKLIWLQLGVGHAGAEKKARSAGIPVVSELCILVEHRRLVGQSK